MLTPLVRVFPGFERGTIPWFQAVPWPGPARWAVQIEPHQDSCDGEAGTFGWDPVTVQVEFQWSGSPQSLYRLLTGRLAGRGFTQDKDKAVPAWVDVPGPYWVRWSGKDAPVVISVSAPIGSNQSGAYAVFNHQWQVEIEARAIGRLVANCP